MELYANYDLVDGQSLNAQILTVNRAGFSSPSQGAGANMPERTSLPPASVRTARSSDAQSVEITWIRDDSVGEFAVISTNVAILDYNGVYRDVSNYCGSNFHSSQICSIQMSVLASDPWYMDRGDSIYA